MNCKYKSSMTKKKAFTLIELLIVIAIIGILFIVLVSKVDFATDKAKATGVQTDFRSFQLAFETVSKEKAGFNSFGWNTGDANANGVRDSVDKGDTNEDGIYQDGETWTGRKKYLETWTNTYSLIRPGTTFAADGYDKDAIFALETAINKNLDPKLYITIDAKTGLITMANGAQDPWNTQYHGAYISAEDGMDRGAIVMYSNGANQQFGSEHDIANGVPTVIVPGNNKDGQDDYSMVVVYTYTNGFGEVGNLTTGFSNNQVFLPVNGGNLSDISQGEQAPEEPESQSLSEPGALFLDGTLLSWESVMLQENADMYGYSLDRITSTDINQYAFYDCIDLVKIRLPDGIKWISNNAFSGCINLVDVVLPDTLTSINNQAFYKCKNLLTFNMPNNVTTMGSYTFYGCTNLQTVVLSNKLNNVGEYAFADCSSLQTITFPQNLVSIGNRAFDDCTSLSSITIENGVKRIGQYTFANCTNLESVYFPNSITEIGSWSFNNCSNLTNITFTNGLTTIGQYAFARTNISSVSIPSSVTSIGTWAFNACHNLSEVVFEQNINLTLINSNVFSECINLLSIEIPDSVTEIANAAFKSCYNLQNVKLSDSITKIGTDAFSSCTNLSEIKIPNSTTDIGWRVFYGCSNLKTVILGNGIESIGLEAFYLCSKIENVYYCGDDEQWQSISMSSGNEYLTRAPLTYNFDCFN